jgi:hypothetical protein
MSRYSLSLADTLLRDDDSHSSLVARPHAEIDTGDGLDRGVKHISVAHMCGPYLWPVSRGRWLNTFDKLSDVALSTR